MFLLYEQEKPKPINVKEQPPKNRAAKFMFILILFFRDTVPDALTLR